MLSTCKGCRVQVVVDWDTGRIRTADGSTGEAMFHDPALVVWDCPACGYPQAEAVEDDVA